MSSAVGEDASALIQAAAMVIQQRAPVTTLERVIQPHPAVTEAVQECMRVLLGRSICALSLRSIVASVLSVCCFLTLADKPHIFPTCQLRRWDPSQKKATHVFHPEDKVPVVPTCALKLHALRFRSRVDLVQTWMMRKIG